VTGLQYVKAGFYRRVLVVGADIMSRVVDPEDKKTFPLFGDGAGAALLGAGSERQGLLSYLLGSDGSGAGLLRVAAGGSREPITVESLADKRQFMRMEGRAVFKWAVRTVHDACARVLDHARVDREDVSLVLLHQANYRILDAVAENLGIPSDRMVMNLQRYGNTSAASMPLALDEAHRAGQIQRGDRLLLAGFGAGLSWGAGLLVW
jgi:3-oxoacyl-[acyl-carrier-protein] synthase III